MGLDTIHRAIERLVILFACLWGSWALYYWVAVLLCDASYLQLKQYAWCFALLFIGSFFALRGTSIVAAPADQARRATEPGPWKKPPTWLFPFAGAAALAAALIALGIDGQSISQSSLAYNLLWAALLPLFLYYLFMPRARKPVDPTGGLIYRESLLDPLLALLFAAGIAFALYGNGFPTPDDAYYINSIAATLSNPQEAVLGSDLLLGTQAPYMIHPAYRTSGYEILIALICDLGGLDYLRFYFGVLPSLNAAVWVLSAYMLLRLVRVPLPGIALAVSLVLFLFWTGGFAPGGTIAFLAWGKSLLFLVGAPLLFMATANLVHRCNLRSWLLLLMVLSGVATWSTSGLFLGPFSAGLAFLVFCPSVGIGIKRALPALLAGLPLLLALAWSLLRLSEVNLYTGGYGDTPIRVAGAVFGGLPIKIAFLLLLAALPGLAGFVGGRFARVARTLSLVAFFTVMSPYMLELIAVVTGSGFLAQRLQFAFPTVLLAGVPAALILDKVTRSSPGENRPGFVITGLAAIAFYVAVVTNLQGDFLFSKWRERATVFASDYQEARAARDLIPDNAFVAAGDIDDLLPLFPNPPTFTYVRHYLDYHLHYMEELEHRDRKRLFTVLTRRLPMKRLGLEGTVDWAVKTAHSLGVSTLVFHAPGGRHRPENNFQPRDMSLNARKQIFVEQLLTRLADKSWRCQQTPSGRTWVCNLEASPAADAPGGSRSVAMLYFPRTTSSRSRSSSHSN